MSTLTTEQNQTPREILYRAAINCKHDIDRECVTLHHNPQLPGNALGQLAERLNVAHADLQRSTVTHAQPVQLTPEVAEIARLTACLKTANATAEEFERKWYLRGDEIEAMQSAQVPLPSELINILREASEIIGAIDEAHAPANIRWPIVDELHGFSLMLMPNLTPVSQLETSDNHPSSSATA